MAEYYYNEDETSVAGLVSCGFGAGWSTWNDSELAYDKRIVEFWLAHKGDRQFMDGIYSIHGHDEDEWSLSAKETVKFFNSLGYENLYFEGFADLALVWIPVGCRWRINEYDGSEDLEVLDMDDYNYVPAKGENNG